MKKEPEGYSKKTDFEDPLRFYELWRGLSNLFMSFVERILVLVGWYHPEG